MKKIALIFAAAALISSCENSENTSNKMAEEQNEQKFDTTKMENDADFAMEAASGGMMEVELGNLAMTNGSSQQVKDFGKSMVEDHSKANDELKTLAQTKNISLPAVPSNDHQKKIDELKEKHGAEFDKDYIDLMVDDHKEDVDHFQKEADNGHDADMKAWASGKVPVLQHHRQMAQDIQNGMKK